MDAIAEIALVLAAIAELNSCLACACNKLARLAEKRAAIERGRFVVRRAPTAQRLAPVVDKVDPIGAGRIFSFENTDVAAPDRIRRVLVIPIGNQHDQDFQAVELRSAVERVPRPSPGAIVEETRSGLEARERRIRKRAVVLDKSRGALECRDSGDAP